jgi:hypothetical protein
MTGFPPAHDGVLESTVAGPNTWAVAGLWALEVRLKESQRRPCSLQVDVWPGSGVQAVGDACDFSLPSVKGLASDHRKNSEVDLGLFPLFIVHICLSINFRATVPKFQSRPKLRTGNSQCRGNL